jgi:hypothetical protein
LRSYLRLFLMINLALLCLYIVKVEIFMLFMDLAMNWFKEILCGFLKYCESGLFDSSVFKISN